MPIDAQNLRGFARDESGTVAVIVALLLTVLLGFVALGVDVASLYRDRANLQADSDMAAMSAVVNPEAGTNRAQQALGRNNRTGDTLSQLTTGRFLRNPAVPRDQRFTPLAPGTPGINAVKVTLQDDAALHFAKIFADQNTVELTRKSTAIRTGAASFSLDSHILRLEGPDLNAALSESFNTTVSLSAGEISLLAETSVSGADILAELVTLTGNTARNPAAILDENVAAETLIAALQNLLPSAASDSLSAIAGAAGQGLLPVTTILGGIDSALGLTAIDFASEIEISALDVVRAVASANVYSHQLDSAAQVIVPGVASVTASLTAFEPPASSGWVALGEEGVQLHRAAARLGTELTLEAGAIGNLGQGVTVTSLNLPIYVELAGATATLEEIDCTSDDPQSTAARFSTAHTPISPENGTSVAALYLGKIDEAVTGAMPIRQSDLDYADILTLSLRIPVPLLPDIEVDGVVLQGRSNARVGASQVDTIRYTKGDVQAGRIVRGFGSGELLTTGVQSLLSPSHTEFRLKPGQGGLVTGLVAPLLNTVLAALPDQLLTTLTVPLDSVLDQVIASAGLRVGEGEITLTGHHCELVRLVQ